MCYFDLTRWTCGYWRWGSFRQQCNKEYRMGETCGLKLVYDTKVEQYECKLCQDIAKKQRRYNKVQREVERYLATGQEPYKTDGCSAEMQDLSEQIIRMKQAHDDRIQTIGGEGGYSVPVTTFFTSLPTSFPTSDNGPLLMPAESVNLVDHRRNLQTSPAPRRTTPIRIPPHMNFPESRVIDTSSPSSALGSKSGRAVKSQSQVPKCTDIPSRPAPHTAEENQMAFGKGVAASEPSGDNKMSPVLGGLYPLRSIPKELNETLDFRSSPSPEQIKDFINFSSASNPVVELTCLVNWQLPELYAAELEPDANIRNVIALTGTLACAELTTCNEFVKRMWKSTDMLELVAKFVESPSTTHETTLSEGVEITIENTHDAEAPGSSNPMSSTLFQFSGPLSEVAILLQQVAWLAAASALPTRDILTISVPVLRITGLWMTEICLTKPVPGRDGQFGLSSDPDAAQCWHNLLRGVVLAYGFPVSSREEGLGLEVPFDLMLGLAEIRTQVNTDDKTILLGRSGVMLYPTKRLTSGMQWHYTKSDGEGDYNIQRHASVVAIAEQDIEQFPTQRMFLGYYPQAEVLLGTRELVHSKLQATESEFPPSPPRIEFANEGTFTGGLSVKGILNMNLSGKYVMTKTLQLSLGGRGFHDLVDEAEERPAIVYDGEAKSAWLVSELSIVLHLTLSYLSSHKIRDRRQTGCKPLQGEWPPLPYAEPCSDGGRESHRVCKRPENCGLELWVEGAKNKTFGDVIEDFLKDFQSVRDGILAQGKTTRAWPVPWHGLRGWEYTDFLGRKTHFSQKEVPRDGHYAPWWELAREKNALVILGNGFGALIRPKASTKSPSGLASIPAGSRLLVASRPCMLTMMLPLVDRAPPAFGSLEWRSIAKHQRSCNLHCDRTSCFSIQVLRARSSRGKDSTTVCPREQVLSAQAVIFGDCEYYHKALFNAMLTVASPLCISSNG